MVEEFPVVLEKCSTILTENAVDIQLLIVMLYIRMIILDGKGTPDIFGYDKWHLSHSYPTHYTYLIGNQPLRFNCTNKKSNLFRFRYLS